MKFGLIGSGSWGTALVKILTERNQRVHWCVRDPRTLAHIRNRGHNPRHLSSVLFDTGLLELTTDPEEAFMASDTIVIAVPSAFVADTLGFLSGRGTGGRRVVSAVKGLVPQRNQLLNDFLADLCGLPVEEYHTIMGPCHAEEVAAEKLSYLTFSGVQEAATAALAEHFRTSYINTVVNTDLYGVQFAAILKNIYALGAGIAHGLEYGDNFLSVLIANCADEMAGFLRRVGIRNVEVGVHLPASEEGHRKSPNYAASVYLGDLLVTCYSPFSRNRTFGNMIGKGYSVTAAQLELDMVAEGYAASRCMHEINRDLKAEMPIAETIHRILWQHLPAAEGMTMIEAGLI